MGYFLDYGRKILFLEILYIGVVENELVLIKFYICLLFFLALEDGMYVIGIVEMWILWVIIKFVKCWNSEGNVKGDGNYILIEF